MTPKLLKAADVCELAQLQPYMLRSWEKEFPGIGVQQAPDGPRLYRESDIEQVQRIRQLVFGEGLTLAGARRRLEESDPALMTAPVQQLPAPSPVPETRKVAPSKSSSSHGASDDVRARIVSIRDGLRSLLTMLGGEPEASVGQEYQLEAPVAAAPARGRNGATRRAPEKRLAPEKRRAPDKRRASETKAVAKRKRASA